MRDSVRSDLAKALGRRKDRPLDLESLQNLPVAELAQACRAARLPPSDDPRAMARALHALLGPAGRAVAAAPTGAQPQQQAPAHAPAQRPTLRHAAAAAAATEGAAVAAARVGAAGSSPARGLPGAGETDREPAGLEWGPGLRGEGAAGAAGLPGCGSTAGADADPEAAAAAALLEAAEREADELFEGELRRRLERATAGAAGRAGPPSASQQPRVWAAGGGSSALHAALSPLLNPRPADAVPTASRQQQQQQQQQQQAAERPGRTPLFLSTTERLAATAPAAVDPAAFPVAGRGGAFGGASGGSGGGGPVPAGPLLGASASPYGPQPSARPHPSEVQRAVRRCLSRQGYVDKEPRALRSLLLLRRADLTWLLRDFCGLFEDDIIGQGREQMAARLLQFMSAGPQPGPAAAAAAAPTEAVADARALANPSLAGVAPPSGIGGGAGQVAESGVGMAAAAERAASARAGLTRPGREARAPAVEADGGSVVEWDEEAAAMGDPRRREVLAAARRRRQLMARAAQPEEIAGWLVKARAQDVVLIHLPQPQPQLRPLLHGKPAEDAASPASACAAGSYVLLATGLSQRHAYACAQAVRYQIRERLQELAAAAAPGSERRAGSYSPAAAAWGPHDVPGAPAVAGVNGGDWMSLEAGNVQVHVMTAPARQYYRLEELFLGPAGEAAPAAAAVVGAGRVEPGRVPRVQLFGAAAGERQPETLETARVDEEAVSARG